MNWTPQMDAAIAVSAGLGQTAGFAASCVGVTRNATIGRARRIGVQFDPLPEVVKARMRKSPGRPAIAKDRKVFDWPSDTKERMAKMAPHATMAEIAASFGCSAYQAKKKAISLGVLPERKWLRMTEEVKATIRSEFAKYTPASKIAEMVGRSEGVVRQFFFINDMHRDGRITIAVRKFGPEALEYDPDPLVSIKIAERRFAENRALNGERAIREKKLRIEQELQRIHRLIAAGVPRNSAMAWVASRSTDLNLNTIAVEFGISRERVRQICDRTNHRFSSEEEIISMFQGAIQQEPIQDEPVLTERSIRGVLAELSKVGCLDLTVRSIQEAAAKAFRVDFDDLVGPNRRVDFVEARHIAMCLVRLLLRLSTTEIGRAFGARDHTTVLHALTKRRTEVLGYLTEYKRPAPRLKDAA